MIFITTYNRPHMLLNLLKELEGERIFIIDDCSTYDPSPHKKYCEYYRMDSHQGKKEFWKLWDIMLDKAMRCGDNEFIFLQDDLTDVDLSGLRSVWTPHKYALNLMDVGPDRGWTNSGYVDCIMKTNRATMEDIGWYIKPVKGLRFRMDPNLSSGVGQYLSHAFEGAGIPMLMPDRNYASHGNHESLMHPDLRKQEPLIAQAGE